MSKYDLVIDLKEENDPRTKMIDLIGPNKKVLEFGCATGYMSKVLREKGCTVTGVEIDPGAAKKARKYCCHVVIGDVERENFFDVFKNESFDVIVLGDFIEHLKDPERFLVTIRGLFNKQGYLVTSIPNIAHVSMRLQLLGGKFEYQELGLLDNTHLRFYTKNGIAMQMKKCGYRVSQMDIVTKEIDLADLKPFPEELKRSLLEWIEKDPESRVYEYIVKSYPIFDYGVPSSSDVNKKKSRKTRTHRVSRIKSIFRELISRINDVEKVFRSGESEEPLPGICKNSPETDKESPSIEEEDIKERLKRLGYM